MDTTRWQRLQELFAEVRDSRGEARAQLLAGVARFDPELHAELESLLAADADAGIMDALAPRFAPVSRVLADSLPARIGAYRIVGEVGRGGMGVVYLGERDDGQFEQRVAIKLISATDESDPLHRRFLAERQILAGLVHPNIARLLDGGITEDGRPYVVLEYIDGVPITTYCDRHRLDLRARLRLFNDVCDAVQHAHRNLIIHRDLKPSNILVSSDARVHLLDFGIAKLLDPGPGAHAPLTHADVRAMTPEYASPEQMHGEVLTTASDVYSLGVLLYELLCGCSPYELPGAAPAEFARAVTERDPPRPSARITASDRDAQKRRDLAERRRTTPERLARELAGDVDGIVLMALRKEPAHRYASADLLRQDVERYLTGLPVIAHRGGRRYRIGKFMRRHRTETIAAAAMVATLLIGLSVSIAQSRRASRERDRAERALAESEGVTGFLMELFRTGDADRAGTTAQLSALELVERGAQRASELSDQPVVQARLMDVVGQMWLHLGRFDAAQQMLEQAVAIRRSSLGSSSPDLATSLIHLSRVHRARNEYDRARPLVEEALRIRQRALPARDPAIAEALHDLGWLTAGKPQERLYRQALAILPDIGATAEQRMTLQHALSTNVRRQGRLAEALIIDREALRMAERAFGPEHHTTGYALIHLADHVYDIEQDTAEAERLYRRGLELMTRHFGENSVRLIHGLNSLAHLQADRGSAEAERLLRRVLAIRQSVTGHEHPQVADALQFLAGELARRSRLREAEGLARQALALSRRTLGPSHRVVTDARLPFLAEILDRQGRRPEAEELYHTALAQTKSGALVLGQMRRSYGLLLLRHREFVRAEEQLLLSLQLLEQAYGNAEHQNVHETKRALTALYEAWEKPDRARLYQVPPGRFVAY